MVWEGGAASGPPGKCLGGRGNRKIRRKVREDGVQAWAHSLPSAPLSGASFLHGSRGKAWWSAWQGPGRREQRWLGVPLPHSGPWTSPGRPLPGIGHRGTLPECGDRPRLPGSPPRPGGVARAAISEWGEEKAQQRASVAERTRGRTGRPDTCPNLPLPPRRAPAFPIICASPAAGRGAW